MADYEDKVIELLGQANYERLLQACAKASIQDDHLLQIAKKLHGTVYGNLLRKSQARDFRGGRAACREMLSDWYSKAPGSVSIDKIHAVLMEEELLGVANQLVLRSSIKDQREGISRTRDLQGTPVSSVELPIEKVKQSDEFNEITGDHAARIVGQAMDKAGINVGWRRKVGCEQEGVRNALIIGNTYKKKNNVDLHPLPGCKESVQIIRKVLGNDLSSKDKKTFECTEEVNRSAKALFGDLEDFCEKSNEEHADTILIYFSGHGGTDMLKLDNKPEDIEENQMADKDETHSQSLFYFKNSNAIVKEGGNFIYGDPDENNRCEKIYKNDIISLVCKSTRHVQHRIIIFDCCRGDKSKEMGSVPEDHLFRLRFKFSATQSLSNSEFKNTFVFHSTLPHQVAWCSQGGKGPTKFSTYFEKFVSGPAGPVDLSLLDEVINAALKNETIKEGHHKQMVELVKWVDTPFQW